MTDNSSMNFRKHPEYKKQMKHLAELITEGQTGKGKFIALGVEAGVGKSRETDKAIARYLNNVPEWDRKFLLVKRYKEDVYESAKRINTMCQNHHVAIGITEDEWAKFLNDQDFSRIEMYQVVIITHARYRGLSQTSQDYFRAFFEKDRHTLVIDEQLEVPVFSFSKKTFGEILACLSYDFKDILDLLCEPLHRELEGLMQGQHGNRLVKVNPEVDEQLIREFENRVNSHHFWNREDRNKVKLFIDFLYNLNTTTCLYNHAYGGRGGRISSLCLGLDRWTLQNNIILDANVGIDKRYKYAKDMQADVQPKFVDHNRFTFNHVNFNSSRTNKFYAVDFYPKVINMIVSKKSKEDKALIVTHKIDEGNVVKELEKQGFKLDNNRIGKDISVAHFGEIIGKNRWREFNQVWVIASPNIPMEVYALNWCFFAQRRIGMENLLLKRPDGSFGFRNDKFEDVRIGYLVSEIYQAIKRIDREVRKDSQIYVATDNKEVVASVMNQLKNVRVGEVIELDVTYKNDQEKGEPRRRGRKSNRVEEMKSLILNELQPGEYYKSQLYSRLGWEPNGQTGRIWSEPEIKALEPRIISIERQKIVKLNSTPDTAA